MLLLCGCGREEVTEEPPKSAEYVKPVYMEQKADSLDEEAVLVSIDEDKKEIRFYNMTAGRIYTLVYDNTTRFSNRFGDELVTGQLSPGDMAVITFIKDKKQLKTFRLSEDISIIDAAGDFSINTAAMTMTIGTEEYEFAKTAAAFSSGEKIELSEIHPIDQLRVAQKDHVIRALTVSRGHGYVRLVGADAFVGGWVEVGSVVSPVTGEDLLTVPTGAYDLYISKDGVAGEIPVTVEKDTEAQADVSGLQTDQIKKTGKIVFTITPSGAKLSVDGEETDYTKPVELDCGIHQIRIKATGYKTLTQYIKVGETPSTINVDLEISDGKEEEDSDDSRKNPSQASTGISTGSSSGSSPVTTGVSTGSDTNTSNTTNTTKPNTAGTGNTNGTATGTETPGTVSSASEYRVYIDAPVYAELYVDGAYVGIVPTSFEKKKGTYIVSLRRDGYANRSYTIQVDDSEQDVSYSFSDLVKEE